MSTPTPSPLPTASPIFTSVPTGTATPTPVVQAFDDDESNVDSDDPSTERPESATDAIDDATTDTSTTMGTADSDNGADDGAVTASEGEANEEDSVVMPFAPTDTMSILWDFFKFIVERLLDLMSRFSRSMS
jgi:hypothetical protein